VAVSVFFFLFAPHFFSYLLEPLVYFPPVLVIAPFQLLPPPVVPSVSFGSPPATA